MGKTFFYKIEFFFNFVLCNKQKIMTTRSGKIYSANKCCSAKGVTYYRSNSFNNLCSYCYANTVTGSEYAEKINKLNCNSWKFEKHSIEDLKKFIDERKSDDNNHFIKTITKLIINNIISTKEGLEILQKIIILSITHNFKGLTADQAGNIMDEYRNKFGGSSIFEKINPHLQHLLSGLVFDYWNIDQNMIGSVGYCYYADWGKKPLKYDKNHNINNIPEAPFTYGIDDDCDRKIISKYRRWCIDGFESIKIKLNM